MYSISGAEIAHEQCMYPLTEFHRTIIEVGKMLLNHHINNHHACQNFSEIGRVIQV